MCPSWGPPCSVPRAPSLPASHTHLQAPGGPSRLCSSSGRERLAGTGSRWVPGNLGWSWCPVPCLFLLPFLFTFLCFLFCWFLRFLSSRSPTAPISAPISAPPVAWVSWTRAKVHPSGEGRRLFTGLCWHRHCLRSCLNNSSQRPRLGPEDSQARFLDVLLEASVDDLPAVEPPGLRFVVSVAMACHVSVSLLNALPCSGLKFVRTGYFTAVSLVFIPSGPASA